MKQFMQKYEILRFATWEEYGERAYALIDQHTLFDTAINCCRDGSMGEKDDNGIYERHWYGDYADSADSFKDTVRPMDSSEIDMYLDYVKDAIRNDDIMVEGTDSGYTIILRPYKKRESLDNIL